jgi:acyl transferase domain-containing protein/NAD(P)-dependent dehydrogenase (short-subunit alcohol dehydrogenase family)
VKTDNLKPAHGSGKLAIIGIGCLFPGAENASSFWANIREGLDAISEIPTTHWKPADYYDPDQKKPDHTYGQRGGFIAPFPFNPLEYNLPPNTLEAIDTSQLLGMVAAGQALKDAGYGGEKSYDRSRVSVILGVTGAMELVIPLGARLGHPIWRSALKDAGVDDSVAEDVVQRIADSYVPWQENSFPGLLGNVVAGRISKQYDLGGTNCIVDAACGSSLGALNLAGLELLSGKSDMVVTGGIDTFNDIFMYICFSKTPALSPTGNAKPFDKDADGTILGEGLGVLVIKRLEDAERDGDRIYAVIKGIGSSSDGKGDAIYAPSAGGQKRALRNAYQDAGVTPESIAMVESHGTGTKVGDVVEVSALREVFGEAARPWCALGSVKAQIGHTKAAAGAAGLIKAALALHHKVLPPTIKITNPLDEVTGGKTPFYLQAEKRPWLPYNGAPRLAGVSAFGFGGSNFHVVLEEYTPAKTVVDWDGTTQILPFSAASVAELEKKIAAVPAAAPWNELRAFAATTRKSFSDSAPFRLVLAVERTGNLTATLATVTAMLKSRPAGRWSTPDGAFFSSGARAGKTALLFPGQGSQYTGMLRDLACAFPELSAALTAADKGFSVADESRLSDRIYPPSDFSVGAASRQEEELRATDVAQPAIGAVSIGALRILESFGFSADAAAGHSYGELTALCAAGCIDETALHELSRLRGSLMAGDGGDRGGMLAISASLATVETIIQEEALDLVIANRNSPNQAVLSGTKSEIDRAATIFSARGLNAKKLPVAAAFHSPLVAAAAKPFRAALEDIELHQGNIPVYANSSAALYPTDPGEAKALLANQLAAPVEFVAEIEAMYAAGVRTFVEVGPGGRLTGLVKAILGDRDHTAVALDASSGKKSGIFDLARALAQLSAAGLPLQLARWDDGFIAPPLSKKPAMTIPLCGTNYVQTRQKKTPTAVKAEYRCQNTGVRIPEPVQQPVAASRDALAASLQMTRESMAILQKMQEDTARLHRQFLEGQEAAGRTFQTLLENQQRLLMGEGLAPLPTYVPGRVETSPPLAMPEVRQVTPLAASAPAVGAPLAAPTAPVQGAASSAPTVDAATALLAVVSEKTGYPVEMLDLEMGLDADLGIDSIKRVEILSAIQEKLPAAPLIGPEHLGSLQTLGEIANFLSAGFAGTPLAVSAAAEHGAASSAPTVDAATALLAVVSEKTGYPVEMLDLEMGLDADLGIDSIKRVEILSAIQEKLPAAPLIGPEHLGSLQTLGEIANFLSAGFAGTPLAVSAAAEHGAASSAPTVDTTPAATIIKRSALVHKALDHQYETKPIRLLAGGEILITDDGSPLAAQLYSQFQERGFTARLIAADDDKDIFSSARISGLIIIAPKGGTDDRFLEQAFLLLKRAAAALRQAGELEGALFATISRLDGAFGCRAGSTLADPLSGGLAGLSKTAAHEWSEVICRALDLGEFADPAAAAAAIVGELLVAGPIETGLSSIGKTGLILEELPAAATPPRYPVSAGDVVVITGGGRGVTAAAALALTKASQPTLLLLGRSPEPKPEAEWLSGLTEESPIKRAILEHANGKLHPKEIEERYQQVVAGRELHNTLARIAAAGGKALYRAVDIRNSAEVADVLRSIRAEFGPIRGIVHGAGVLADRLITEKSREQFAAVYGTKVSGLRSLFAATAEDDLRFIALFSSTTGRFGRTGQVDYAVANEVLNKLAQDEAHQRPECRTVSINWGPWDGGMVTPALKKLFASEGIGLIGMAEGGDFLVREIAAADAPVEIIALAETAAAIAAPLQPKAKQLTEALALSLNLDNFPFLRSHVLDGKAVLPMAVIAEWLAHAALHGNPGLRFHGFNDLRICKGVVFEQASDCRLNVMAGKAEKRDSFYLVPVELTGLNGGARPVLHAKAEIVLATRLPEGIRSIKELPVEPYELHNGRIYDKERLFHGPDLHGIETVSGCSEQGIAALIKSAPTPSAWLKQPLRSSWLTDPLALDSAFQLMILWSFYHYGHGSLPCFAGRYRQFQESFPKDGVQVVIKITDERTHGAHADIEFIDRHSGKLVARLEDYECVIDPNLGGAFQRNQLELPGKISRGAL